MLANRLFYWLPVDQMVNLILEIAFTGAVANIKIRKTHRERFNALIGITILPFF